MRFPRTRLLLLAPLLAFAACGKQAGPSSAPSHATAPGEGPPPPVGVPGTAYPGMMNPPPESFRSARGPAAVALDAKVTDILQNCGSWLRAATEAERRMAAGEAAKLRLAALDMRLHGLEAVLHPVADGGGPPPSPQEKAKLKAEYDQAVKGRQALDKEVAAAQAARPPRMEAAAFDRSQTALRRLWAENKYAEASTLLAQLHADAPTLSAEQIQAIRNDLEIYRSQGGAPFLAGLPAVRPAP